MKKILTILLPLILLLSFTSDLNAQSGKKKKEPLEYPENYNKETYLLKYEEVVQVDSSNSKDILFDKLNRFVVFNYTSSNDVIQLNDKEGGNIIVKGNLTIIDPNTKIFTVSYVVPHVLDIKVKDGRFKYTLTSEHIYNPKNPINQYYKRLIKFQSGIKILNSIDVSMNLFILAQVSLVLVESLEYNLSGIHSNLINSLAIFTAALRPLLFKGLSWSLRSYFHELLACRISIS